MPAYICPRWEPPSNRPRQTAAGAQEIHQASADRIHDCVAQQEVGRDLRVTDIVDLQLLLDRDRQDRKRLPIELVDRSREEQKTGDSPAQCSSFSHEPGAEGLERVRRRRSLWGMVSISQRLEQQRSARGGAERDGEALGESHALGCHPVDVWRLVRLSPVDREALNAQVVGKDDDDIGFRARGIRGLGRAKQDGRCPKRGGDEEPGASADGVAAGVHGAG